MQNWFIAAMIAMSLAFSAPVQAELTPQEKSELKGIYQQILKKQKGPYPVGPKGPLCGTSPEIEQRFICRMLQGMTAFMGRNRYCSQGFPLELVLCQTNALSQGIVMIPQFRGFHLNLLQFKTIQKMACQFTAGARKILFFLLIVF